MFAHPQLLWFLAALPLLGLLRLWSHLRTAKRLPGLVSPKLHDRLIVGGSQLRRWLVHLCLLAALASFILALARPQWGFEESETESESRNLIVAIDTSRSMLATDLAPNRLLRAKLAATDIVSSLPEERIGLIAFAGRAFLQAPLTVDHDAVIEAIDQLDTDIIPRGGTNLSAPIQLALETFDEAEAEQGALVIFSDGEALEGQEEIEALVQRAARANMAIVTIGVGTEEGALIPESDAESTPLPGQFLKDREGQIVRTRLDASALRGLAADRGTYLQLGGSSSVTGVVERIIATLAATRREGEIRRRPIERFAWPLSAGLAFLLLAHVLPFLLARPAVQTRGQKMAPPAPDTPTLAPTPNRPATPRPGRKGTRTAPSALVLVGLILLALSAPAPPARASEADFLGYEAYRQQRYDESIAAYESGLKGKPASRRDGRLQLGIGASAYQQGDYQRAAEAFGQALLPRDPQLQETAHYNLGNTLFRQGEAILGSGQHNQPDALQPMSRPGESVEDTLRQWESSLEHYESALALNPGNDKARTNYEVVKRRIEELEKEQEEQQQQENQDQDQEEEKENQEQEEQKQEEQKEDQQDQEQEDQQDREQDEQDQEQEDQKDEEQEGEEDKEQDPQDPQQAPDGEPDPDDGQEPEGEPNPEGKPDQDSQDGSDPPGAPDEPPPPPDEDLDGEVEANPNQSQPDPPAPGKAPPADREPDPETGYSPSEARQLLRSLADETEVRPLLEKARDENYKDW